MGFEVRPNSGSLFENDKEGNDARPDMKGKIRIGDDQAFWISGWWKESRNGSYLSLSFEEMTAEQITKYMPEVRLGRAGSPPPREATRRIPARPASYGANSEFARRSQEAVKKAQDRAQAIGRPLRGPEAQFDDVPLDDDIPF